MSLITVPTDERLAELLQNTLLRGWAVADALWKLHPERCIAWATDPLHPYQGHFLEICPDEHVADVVRAVTEEPALWVSLNLRADWATQRIARPEAQCGGLLSLLAMRQKQFHDALEAPELLAPAPN